LRIPSAPHFAPPLMTVHTIDQSNGELKPSHWVEIIDPTKS
jgi:hypothetical protein